MFVGKPATSSGEQKLGCEDIGEIVTFACQDCPRDYIFPLDFQLDRSIKVVTDGACSDLKPVNDGVSQAAANLESEHIDEDNLPLKLCRFICCVSSSVFAVRRSELAAFLRHHCRNSYPLLPTN
ncbi:unnamed protein product [Pieris macdunnoughi]|uniref:Uncharacterized protein n=1 Tax=Pieris macdunnoughi TaxID=345717 RepID=A0A821S628_9NEOP|nr:unnamed protein product [Pieris macdunnoughi]